MGQKTFKNHTFFFFAPFHELQIGKVALRTLRFALLARSKMAMTFVAGLLAQVSGHGMVCRLAFLPRMRGNCHPSRPSFHSLAPVLDLSRSPLSLSLSASLSLAHTLSLSLSLSLSRCGCVFVCRSLGSLLLVCPPSPLATHMPHGVFIMVCAWRTLRCRDQGGMRVWQSWQGQPG